MNHDTEKQIRFIDSHYNELFRINDGDMIRITLSDGSYVDRACKYIDDYHVKVGNNFYHICEFAELMERNGNKVNPNANVISKQRNKQNSKER